MRPNRVLIAAAVLVTAAAAGPTTAYAHGGGRWRPPAGEVPPDSREPDDPPPPPEEGLEDPADSLRSWAQHNLPAIVGHLRAARERRPRLSRTVVETTIAPALRRLVCTEGVHGSIRSAAILALAKTDDASLAPSLRALVDAGGESLTREVEESAVLALGLLRTDGVSNRAWLIERLNQPDPRNWFVRPFAAVALGLLGADGEHAAAGALLDAIARAKQGSRVRPACLLALGLLSDETALPDLVAWARGLRAAGRDEAPLSDVERAFAVEALGRLDAGGPALVAFDAIAWLVELRHSVESVHVRRSAVIALGRIAGRCDARARRAAAVLLRGVADDDAGGEMERRLALIALGRLGAAPGTRSGLRSWITEYLRCDMETGRGGAAGFAAVALALAGRAAEDGAEDGVRTPLRARFAAEARLDRRGAYALASGLAGDPAAVMSLRHAAADTGLDRRLRGCCVLALGMIGDSESRAVVSDALWEGSDRDQRVECATALDLLGDATAVEGLVAVLRDRDVSNYELGSAALALGRVGDERAVPALLDIAADADGRLPDLTRALAVRALGQLSDTSDVPLLARIGTDVNYRTCDPAITELLTIL